MTKKPGGHEDRELEFSKKTGVKHASLEEEPKEVLGG